MTDRPGVLVVGAGPAGAASALLAARRGLRVTLADRARFPREKPCSEYMAPDTARLLDGLGVLGTLEQAGAVPLTGTTVRGPRGGTLQGHFARAPGTPWRQTGLAMPRRVLDQVLLAAARDAGVTVLEGHAFGSLAPGSRGAFLHGPDGGVVHRPADLVIGADGLRTRVGRAIGRRRHGFPRRIAFVAHVQGVEGLGTGAEMQVGPRGYVGLNPVGDGVTNVALVLPAADAASARGDVEGFFRARLSGFGAVADRVPMAGLVQPVRAIGPFAASSSRITAPGVALVGDAAEFFDPFTGEGIWSALRGAELLDEAVFAQLASGGSITAGHLAAYRRARRRAFAGKWAVERLIGCAMFAPGLFDRAVTRLGRRPGMADTLIGVTGMSTPARAVLNPWFLARMMA